MNSDRAERGAGQGEALGIWATWGAVAVAVVVTYARVPLDDLYNVSETGLRGGLGRALVLVNFPIALVAVALVLVALDALPAAAGWLGAAAIALCASVAVPGVVDQNDLDASPVNALPATGVLLALAMTVAAATRAGARPAPRSPEDRARAVAVVVVLALSLPWVAADLGFHLPGDVLLGEEHALEPDGSTLAAVHLGHHHGLDGALLAVTAIVLTRVRLSRPGLRRALAAYLSLMLAYGLVNAAQDLWLEQVVKRGWTDARIPEALRPEPSVSWLAILALSGLAYAIVTSRRFHARR